MFRFLKEKLKKAVSTFSRRVEEEAQEEKLTGTELEIEKELKEGEEKEEKEQKERAEKKEKRESLQHIEKRLETIEEEIKEEVREEKSKEGKKGIFERVFGRKEEAGAETKTPEREAKVGEKDVREATKAVEEEKVKEIVEKELKEESRHAREEAIELETRELSEGKTAKEIAKTEKNAAKHAEEEEKRLVKAIQEKVRTAQRKAGAAEEKEGFFKRLTQKVRTKKISGIQFEEFFWELEVAMLENNVAVEAIEKIKDDLKRSLVEVPIRRGKIQETIFEALKNAITSLFKEQRFELIKRMEKKKPYIICFVGVNGSGKTTTIAKFGHMLKKQGKSVVLAAADTFRAAAIDQLEEHANKLGVRLIKHDYGSDPAAVAFDAIKHAEAKKEDVVLVDTAGRMHSNINLVDEMKKIVRVAKPDAIIFVGESITGNDCVEQARRFNEAIGIDGIVLAKADVDEKGGAAISTSYVTKKPIIYLGVGQGYDDLEEFDVDKLLRSIGL